MVDLSCCYPSERFSGAQCTANTSIFMKVIGHARPQKPNFETLIHLGVSGHIVPVVYNWYIVSSNTLSPLQALSTCIGGKTVVLGPYHICPMISDGDTTLVGVSSEGEASFSIWACHLQIKMVKKKQTNKKSPWCGERLCSILVAAVTISGWQKEQKDQKQWCRERRSKRLERPTHNPLRVLKRKKRLLESKQALMGCHRRFF